MVLAALRGAIAAQTLTGVDDLTELSLEELGTVSVSAAAKHAQPLFATPAAASVLLPNEIIRSGHASVMEALRLVPGVQVAQASRNHWVIGMRDLDDTTSSKLLVLVDGRSVLSPFRGDVDWSAADVSMGDLARLEMVRGPNTTLWGTNAVNGVINIVTKSARDTQGSELTVRGGAGDPLTFDARHGGQFGSRTWYRVSARGTNLDRWFDPNGNGDQNDERLQRLDWRVDHEWSHSAKLVWQADYVDARMATLSYDPRGGSVQESLERRRRGSVQGRLERRWSDAGDLRVQLYYDAIDDEPESGAAQANGEPVAVSLKGRTLDLDYDHHLTVAGRHDLIWGGGARRTVTDVQEGASLKMAHPHAVNYICNFFAQDDWTLQPERFHLALGTKVERHDSIGWQVLPNLRFTYTPTRRQTFWAAVVRTVHSPSIVERYSQPSYRASQSALTDGAGTTNLPQQVVGSSQVREEVMMSYEAGWRGQLTSRCSLDLTAYVHDYTHVLSQHLEASDGANLVYRRVSDADAVVRGAEASFNWRAGDRWRVTAGHAWRQVDKHGLDNRPLAFVGARQTSHLHAGYALSANLELSASLYRVERLTEMGVPGYLRTDVQLAWRPRHDLEVQCGVHNAFDGRHPEYAGTSSFPVSEVPRSVFARIQWRY